MFTNCNNCVVEVKRLAYENKIWRPQTMASYDWYITASSEESKVVEWWKFWKIFKLSILALADIKESDTIIVNNEEYSVKWVAQRNGGNLVLTTVILQKWM